MSDLPTIRESDTRNIYSLEPGDAWASAASNGMEQGSGSHTIGDIAGQIWAHKLLFGSVFLLLAALISAAVFTIPPLFTSDAMVMIDLSKAKFSDLPTVISSMPSSEGMTLVRSEVQILGSDGLARQVVKDLDLGSDPNFLPKPSGVTRLRTDIMGWLGATSHPTTAEERNEAAVGTYLKQLTAYNDGKSYIISLSFTAGDSTSARRILDRHLQQYLSDQRAAKQVIITRAQDWLNSQLTEISTKVRDSEQKLQNYVDANHLTRTGGDTIGSRQMSSITGQLADARSDLARKQAYLQELNSLVSGSSPGTAASSSAILGSPLIQRLREQEAVQAAQVAALGKRMGADYPSVVAATASLQDTRRGIQSEILRMVNSARNDVAVAQANTAALAQSLHGVELQVNGEDSANLVIGQLQRDLDAERALYANLLTRSKQIAIQREIQEPDARVVSSPTLPLQPSAPRHGLLLGVGICVAAAVAAALALVVDRLRARSQNLEEIETLCDVHGLGVVPKLKRGAFGRTASTLTKEMAPRTQFAASIQSLRNSVAFATPNRAPQVIVLSSALVGEGKTMLVVCLGRSFALAGNRVLLIDADLRKPGLAGAFRLRPDHGIVDILTGRQKLSAAVTSITQLGLDVLPVERIADNPHDLLCSGLMAQLILQARAAYDVILIDTPPLAAVDDALSLMRLADATVLAVRWGKTPQEVIRGVLRRLHMAHVRCTGVVLNAVDVARYRGGHSDLEAYRMLSGTYFPN